MDKEQINKQIPDIFKRVKEYWLFIALAIGLITTWTNFDNRLGVLEKTIERQDPVYTQIQADIVEIKTTLQFIRLSVDK